MKLWLTLWTNSKTSSGISFFPIPEFNPILLWFRWLFLSQVCCNFFYWPFLLHKIHLKNISQSNSSLRRLILFNKSSNSCRLRSNSKETPLERSRCNSTLDWLMLECLLEAKQSWKICLKITQKSHARNTQNSSFSTALFGGGKKSN